MKTRAACGWGCAAGVVLGCLATASPAAELRTIQTKYYTIHTDLSEDDAREAELRLTLMAEEYARRLEGLAGAVRERLPFFLFKDMRDYIAAGGEPGSVGVFKGDRLMAVQFAKAPDELWKTVQHEGFHQFVLAAVGPGIPIWANEGMAEYFSHGVFCGDRFMVGFIPPDRLARVQKGIRERKFKKIAEMLHLPHQDWNNELKLTNYDQAWSMVHFLAHADNGKYQQEFIGYLRDVSRGQDADRMWSKHFGNDATAFQRRWESYWLDMKGRPTDDLYAEATLSTLTSFYARARIERQSFDTIDAFLKAGRDGTLKLTKNWLPPTLFKDAAGDAASHGTWSIAGKGSSTYLQVELEGGLVLEGRYKTNGDKVVNVDIRERRKR